MKTTEHLGFYGYLRILKPDNLIEAMHNANKSNILFTAILELRRAGTNGGWKWASFCGLFNAVSGQGPVYNVSIIQSCGSIWFWLNFMSVFLWTYFGSFAQKILDTCASEEFINFFVTFKLKSFQADGIYDDFISYLLHCKCLGTDSVSHRFRIRFRMQSIFLILWHKYQYL